jgi:diacylglycerol kinase (ATP)
MKKLFFNLKNSLNGLKVMLCEHSFIVELLCGVILVPYIFYANFDNIYKLIIILIYILLLVFEIMNTAIEKICDKITKKYDKDIKVIKDISSASVFTTLILLIIVIITTEFYYGDLFS